MRIAVLAALGSFSIILAGGTVMPARADGERLAVPAAERGLVIGRLNLMLGAEPGLLFGAAEADPAFSGVLSMRFGITEDLEAFASPVVQSIDPALHEPAIGLTYRLAGAHEAVEVGLRAAGNLALFGDDKAAEAQLGVPVRIHATPSLAIDLTPSLLVPLTPDVAVGAQLPIGVTVSAGDMLFASVAAGVRVPDFGDADATLAIPLGAAIGATFRGSDGPWLDAGVRADWDDVRHGDDVWTLRLFARIYLYP